MRVHDALGVKASEAADLIKNPHDRSMWRYRSRLPGLDPTAEPVTLGEGGTPLLRSRLLPGHELFLKDETRNPTGSHKDRALALAATDARHQRARSLVVVSAGSTGLSTAAYASRAGLPAIVVVPADAPLPRTAPLAWLGARIIRVDAPIDPLIDEVNRLASNLGLYNASTVRAINAVQADAGRTIAYELADEPDGAPDCVIVPVGGGGSIAAVHAGFRDLLQAGRIGRLPRLTGIVPMQYDTLLHAFKDGPGKLGAFFDRPRPVGGPTMLSKIAHDHPPDGVHALEALWESGGDVIAVSDEQAVRAVAEIGAADGLFLEPSSAVILPALRQLSERGSLNRGDRIVALACGSGFRETATMLDFRPPSFPVIGLRELGPALAS